MGVNVIYIETHPYATIQRASRSRSQILKEWYDHTSYLSIGLIMFC